MTPLALVLFRRLPDRGYLLSKPLGLLLLAYPVWLVVSLKLVALHAGDDPRRWLLLLVASAALVAYRLARGPDRAFAARALAL